MMGDDKNALNTNISFQSRAFGCASWSLWILVTMVGSGAGWYLGWWVSIRIQGQFATPILGVVVGLILGFSQWMLLRSYLQRAGWWIPASGLGWAVGFPVGASMASLAGLTDAWFGVGLGLVVGLITGILQWLLLRPISNYALWWVPANLFAWAAALMFYRGGLSWVGAYFGVLVGIATGLALLGIFGFPKEEA